MTDHHELSWYERQAEEVAAGVHKLFGITLSHDDKQDIAQEIYWVVNGAKVRAERKA